MNDDAWLDGLAGRGADFHDDTREGRLLRVALQSRASARSDDDAAEEHAAAIESRQRTLLARARTAGLLPQESGAPRGSVVGGRPPALVTRWLAAAALAALGVGLAWQLERGEPTIERAGPAIVRLTALEPAALQVRIADELRSADVDARTYERLDVYGIDAELPQPLTASVREVLARHRIPVPADAVLQVEIRAAR